ncbi:hypothetical protein Ani05nite_21790 [Amorphoplanes nipponensis]|uniref:Uncharacterized protein n=2 Tax=Actinoplanes nipponensis TaxID=135950 RepID=A0A919JG12_9ACTN|nr:hypothetical protein Ani05nite_21790 [Actinoplanes nipponensis]
MLLLAVSRAGEVDWTVLGNIGQAYGLASALVSSVALVAVARTLSLQTRLNKISHLQAFRSMQAEVARFSFDHPDECLGMVGATTPEEQAAAKANIFRTLHARYFLAGLELGEFSEWEVRHEFAAGLFSTEGGRNWWRWARPGWVDPEAGASPTRVRFGRLLDEAFNARHAGPEGEAGVDTSYEGLAARSLADGDLYSGRAWVPGAAPTDVPSPAPGAPAS